MADRELLFLLKMRNETDRALRAARQDLQRTGRTADNVSQRTSRGFTDVRRNVGVATTAVRTFGAALAALGAIRIVQGSLQQFSDFDRALIGVRRTTGLAGDELEGLGEQIEALSLASGAGASELAAITQAAGQLGVQGSDNLIKFTQTIAQLGVATDVRGEQAALAVARILNVTGEGTEVVDQFGAALAGLGNTFAATESEILAAATRVAQAAGQFGVTSAEVLGIGTALRSVGVQAEAGGTQIGLAFQSISAAVNQGGDELIVLNELLGQSQEQLAELFREDPTELFLQFVTALGEAKAAGEDIVPILDAFGLSGVRAASVFGALASDIQGTRDAILAAGQEFEAGTALTDEFGNAQQAFQVEIQRTQQSINDLQRDIGKQLAPVVRDASVALREALADEDVREGVLAIAEGVVALSRAAGEAVGQVLDLARALKSITDLDFQGVVDAVANIGRNSPTGQFAEFVREQLGLEEGILVARTEYGNRVEEDIAVVEAQLEELRSITAENDQQQQLLDNAITARETQLAQLEDMREAQVQLNAEVVREVGLRSAAAQAAFFQGGQGGVPAGTPGAGTAAAVNRPTETAAQLLAGVGGGTGTGSGVGDRIATRISSSGGRDSTPVADIITRLEDEVRLLGVAEDQRERLRTVIALENAAKERGRELTAQERAQVDELLAAREASREAEKPEEFNTQLSDQIAQIDLQIELLGANEEARRRIVAVTRLVQEATEAGFSTEQIDEFTGKLEGAFDRLEAAEAAFRGNAFGGIQDALQEYAREADNLRGAFDELTAGALNEFEDSLVRAAETGEISFSNMADSIISDLNRIAAQQVTRQLSEQLFGIASQLAGGGAGGGGGGGILGGLLGGGGGGGGGLLGGLFSGITGFLGFKEGGTTNGIAGAVSGGLAPASAFKGARHFQTGGLTGGIPAVLHRDEAVVPLSGGRTIPVEMTGGGSQDNRRPVNITMNVMTPDVDSFRRSQGQIAADLGQQVERATRRNT